MDLAGLRLAFDHALSVEIEPGFTVRVAPREVVAVLKMAAYMDRPHDRERERAIVRKFTALVRSEDDPSNTQARMVAAAPPGWRGDPSEMLNRIAAFERGFGPTERRAG
jgi:hypothetical protein